MHARGHRLSTGTPIFLCPKTKRNKTREKGTAGKSHARTCKRSQVEHRHSHFLCLKMKSKEKTGERRNWRESCTKVQEDTRQSAVTPIFYAQQQNKIIIREPWALYATL